MVKQKNIFKRYFSISIVIIIISLLILGVLLINLFNNYFINQKRNILTNNTQIVSQLIQNNIEHYNGFTYINNSATIQKMVNTLSLSSQADVFITDTSGYIIMSSENQSNNRPILTKIPPKIVNDILNDDNYFSISNLEGFYSQKHYTAGTSFYNNLGSEKKEGAVIFTYNVSELKGLLFDLIKLFIISIFGTLFVAILLVWFFTKKLTLPIRDMAVSARCFDDGDLSMRVEGSNIDEINKIANTFNHMANSLQNVEDVRRIFISNVSHELKTPMTTISGFIDGITDGTIKEDKQMYYLNIVSKEVKRLSRLVNNMRELTKIDNNKIKINSDLFNINEIIINIIDTLNVIIKNKNISITGNYNTSNINVFADKDLIYQVTYNLIENAVKFANENGYVNIDVFDDYNDIYVSIKNSGEGLETEEIPFIFDKFYKSDKSRGLDKNGLGLGLYISKNIIKLHGGNITAKSEKHEFTEFKFNIPNNKNYEKIN